MNKNITELEPSISRKRARNEGSELQSEVVENSNSLSLEESLTFSDTLMALQMMRAQFPHIEKLASPSQSLKNSFVVLDDTGATLLVLIVARRSLLESISATFQVSVQPFVLRSQLYSSINDRTQVDRELESLRRERVLRIFKLNTGQDDHAIMFVDDYINQIERVVRRMEEKKQQDLIVFELFKMHVIQSKLDTSISHQGLVNKIERSKEFMPDKYSHLVPRFNPEENSHLIWVINSSSRGRYPRWSLLSLGGKVTEGHISQLINAGLLIRQLIDQNMYWFSIPNIGSVLKGLSQGRKELLSFLNRRKYKEMMLVSLEKKRLRLSPLDMRFHLRDLIGSGHLKTIQSPTGLIVRVAKD